MDPCHERRRPERSRRRVDGYTQERELPVVNTHLNWEETSTRISSRLAELPPKKGVVYVDGPSGVGKTSLLRHFAASAPEAVLVDATGCSTEEVADRVMQAIGVSCGNVRSIPVFTTLVKDRVWNRDFEPKTVVITNTQWAGKTRITHDPVAVATEGIVDEFSRSSKATNIKLVVEIDSEVCDLSPRNRNAILLPPPTMSSNCPPSHCRRASAPR